MPDGSAIDTPALHASSTRPALNWFSDLKFHWDASVTVRKTGVRITLKDLTAGELSKFFGYLGLLLLQAAAVRISGRRRYRICFVPDRPRPWYVVWSAATLAGARFVRDPAQADVIFYFEDVTIGSPPRLDDRSVLNGGVPDISKTTVAARFGKVAGYELAIDPTCYRGKAVEKSEVNGAHDGRIVDCPTLPRAGKSYQRFVDSSDGTTAFDYRTTVINRKPRFVLVKTKPAEQRLSIHNASVHLSSLDKIFSRSEVEIIERYAEEMQLDWGALDVLRDRQSGKIYIVDVNKTDTGPAVDLNLRDREHFKREVARAFFEMLQQRAEPRDFCA